MTTSIAKMRPSCTTNQIRVGQDKGGDETAETVASSSPCSDVSLSNRYMLLLLMPCAIVVLNGSRARNPSG
jgi:hypothetical protein